MSREEENISFSFVLVDFFSHFVVAFDPVGITIPPFVASLAPRGQ